MTRFLHLLFFPHEKNNHRAFLLQPSFIGILIAVYLLNQSFIRSLTITRPGILGYSSEITAQKVLDLTNRERAKQDLVPLHFNQTLTNSALAKAQDMFANNYWAHHSPQGKSPWDFFQDSGYQYTVAGENLAKDFYDTESLVRAWMGSPTHRANIINDKYQDLGIGVVNGILNGVKTTLVVQHFATPLDAIITSADSSPQYTRLDFSDNQVLSESRANTEFTLSPLQVSRSVGLAMFAIIIVVLLIDAYYVIRHPVQRLTGSPLGHISFIVIIFLLLVFIRQGSIF